jgi:competence ComEA-like helix-hairpin-helix protein
MIVLVWNAGATVRHFLSVASPHILRLAESVHDSASLVSQLPAVDCTLTGHPGPLTTKQKYLLGKRVDINKASLAEIEGLPGISYQVAESVVETRNRLGGFRRPEDLLQVKGIKEKRLNKLLPFLVKFPNN